MGSSVLGYVTSVHKLLFSWKSHYFSVKNTKHIVSFSSKESENSKDKHCWACAGNHQSFNYVFFRFSLEIQRRKNKLNGL